MEIYDEELKKFVKKQDKRRKTFKTLAEARKWLHQIELQKAEAKEKKVIYKNEGIRLVDVADEFLELKRKQAKKGKTVMLNLVSFYYLAGYYSEEETLDKPLEIYRPAE